MSGKKELFDRPAKETPHFGAFKSTHKHKFVITMLPNKSGKLHQILQRDNKVITAQSAEDALKLLASEKVDLMLSDAVMPKMDGFELASIVRSKYPHVRIQMVSGYVSDGQPKKISNGPRILSPNRLTGSR